MVHLVPYEEDFSEYAVPKLPIIKDDFSVDNWVDNDSAKIGVSGGVLNFNFVKDGSTDTSTRDLKFVSDNRWMLRFNLIVNTLTNPSIGTSFGIIGISNKTTTGNENFIGMMIVRNSVGIGSYRALSTSNGLPISGVDSSIFTTVPTTSDNYFIEIKRESKNSARMTIFSDSAYTVIVESRVFTTTGGGALINKDIKDLRYIKLQNVIDTGIGGGSIAGTIDNLLFVNGDLGVTFQDDFSGADNWVDVGTKVAVNTTTDVIDWDCRRDGTDQHTSFDLITIIPDKWILRWKCTILTATAGATASQYTVLLSNSGTLGSESSQDHVTFAIQLSTNGDRVASLFVDAGSQIYTGDSASLGTNLIGTGSTFYCELKRNGNIYTSVIYSDSGFTQILGQASLVNTDNLTSLRYIKVTNRDMVSTTGSYTGTMDNIEFFNGQGITFQDDFSAVSPPWTSTGTKVLVNTTTDKITWDAKATDTLAQGASHDFGAGFVDSKSWTLRFKFTVDTFVFQTSNSMFFFIGMFGEDHTKKADVPTTGWHGIYLTFGVTNPLEDVYIGATNGTAINVPATFGVFTTGSVLQTYWYEIKRTSLITAECSIYSDSSYTNLVEKRIFPVPATLTTDLRYVLAKTWDNGVVVGGAWNGTIDDVQFWNGAIPPRPLLSSSIDTIQEDFSSGINWITSNAPNINVGSGVINFNLTQNASNATIARDLNTSFVDAIKWLLRFKINFSSITDQAQAIIGLSSTDQTVNFGTGAQDSLQVEFSALTGANTIHLFYNAGVGRISAGSISLDYTTGTDYYVELIRTENTKATLHIYSNSNFTELIGSLNNITIGSGVSLLRYIKIGNVSSSIDTGNHTGTIDNIEFFNGVSVANTVKRSIPDLEFDFSDSIGWVQTSTGVVVDTVDQRIEGWANDGSDRRVTFDMGSSGILSEQNWTIEFEYEFSASSLPAHGIFTISDVNLDVWFSPAPTVDAIGIFHGTSIDQLVISYKDGSGGNILSTDVIPISFNTRYYVRLERIKNTILKLSVFSDPDFTKHVTSSPIFLTTLSTIANLRYLRSGNASQGSVLRTLTGFLRNLKVYRTVRGTDKDNKYLVIG